MESDRAGTAKEIKRFLAVGSTTVIVDFVTYSIFFKLGTGPSFAKGMGFLVGTFFAYFANKHWTFSGKSAASSTLLPFVFVYGVNLVVNVGINRFVLAYGPAIPLTFYAAFVLATGTSAVLNFVGMKLFVFRSARPKTAQAAEEFVTTGGQPS